MNEVINVSRPDTIPTKVWGKMGPLQQYNLSNGLLVYDKKTKRCKRSKLGGSKNTKIPRDLEFVSEFRDVVKRVQKKTKKKIAKKKARTHHRSIDPLIIVVGNGSFEFSDKSKYVGEITYGVPNGNGIRSWKDGSRYTGGWKNGERVGQGSMVYPTGEEYVGQWENDTKTGRGTMFRKNGSMFTGDWENNLVVVPFTKKSENERSHIAYNLYQKLGTYEKVGNKLKVTRQRAHQLVKRYRLVNTIVRGRLSNRSVASAQKKLDNLDLRFNLSPLRKKFVVATEKLYGRVFVINRKIIYKVLDKNKQLSFPHWIVGPLLRTTTKGWYYFPDTKGQFDLKESHDALMKVGEPPKQKTSISSSSIEKLELTTKTLRILKSNDIHTIRDLTGRTEVDLLKIPTLRNSVIKELKESLEELGLSLSYIQEHSGIRPGTH